MTGWETLALDRRGPVLHLTFARPERRNALHPATSLELQRAFDSFEEDPEQWVGILTGSGDKAFSAGNDLRYQAEHGADAVRSEMKAVRHGLGGLHRRTDMVKPLIAAVNGFALGGGFEIALACDIIVAAEHAVFGLPEPRVGLMAGAGGVHRLPRRIPYHLAMGMMLTGRHVPAPEALSYGLVNEIVPLEDLMPCARRWAAQILECAPLSVRASKQAANRGLALSLDQALYASYPAMQELYSSEDLVEGPRAFAEKRPPRWKGR